MYNVYYICIINLIFFKNKPHERKKIKKMSKKKYLALMNFGNNNHSWLEIYIRYIPHKNENWVFFIRNKDGVNAFHTGSLPIYDYRILKIVKQS